jgi:hypothetical protein
MAAPVGNADSQLRGGGAIVGGISELIKYEIAN